MTPVTAIGIDDNLAARKPAVAMRPTDDEESSGIDVNHRLFVEVLLGNRLLDQLLDYGLTDSGIANVRVVLRRDDDGIHPYRMPVDVAHRDLTLGVGPQESDLLFLAQPRQILHQAMRQGDRQRHQFGRLVAGEAEHQSLVARSLLLEQALTLGNALRDIGRLRLDRRQHRAHIPVEADFVVVVADLDRGLARYLDEVRAVLGGYLAGEHYQSSLYEGFQCDAGMRVFGNQCI